MIGESLSAEPSFFVAAAEFNADHSQMTVDFGADFAASSVSADDLLVDGVPAPGVQIIDGDTLIFDLPELETGSHALSILPGAIVNASMLDINAFHLFFELEEADALATGTKFYVVDTGADSTWEYDADGNVVDSYGLANGNTMPRGAATNLPGDTVWVIDNDDYVYVYDSFGLLLGTWLAEGLGKPEGIATDGTDIWIVDRGSDRVYSFAGAATHRAGTFSPTSSFPLASGNKNPRGITTDGNRLWVVNWSSSSSERVFRYSTTGSLEGSWTIDAGNSSPRGITIDPANPENLWIVDNSADAFYQYLGGGQRTSGSQDADATFALLGSNPQGIADPVPNVVVEDAEGHQPTADLGAALIIESARRNHRAEVGFEDADDDSDEETIRPKRDQPRRSR